MAFNKQLLDIIACPVCKGKLVLATIDGEEMLVSKFERLAYPIKDNIPVLLVSESRTLSQEEMEKLA
ncbi:Trm112 family protein [Agaribacter flavus]|uniref:UPF0434 protein ACFOHL_01365 n=1 Tax=Agaribacter flavus TaxID=1902781 RepID=A0ABV7FP70_9ALTE